MRRAEGQQRNKKRREAHDGRNTDSQARRRLFAKHFQAVVALYSPEDRITPASPSIPSYPKREGVLVPLGTTRRLHPWRVGDRVESHQIWTARGSITASVPRPRMASDPQGGGMPRIKKEHHARVMSAEWCHTTRNRDRLVHYLSNSSWPILACGCASQLRSFQGDGPRYTTRVP